LKALTSFAPGTRSALTLDVSPSLVFDLLHLKRQREAIRHVDDDLARPVRQHRADVFGRGRSGRDEDDIDFDGFVDRDRFDARAEFGGDFANSSGFIASFCADAGCPYLGEFVPNTLPNGSVVNNVYAFEAARPNGFPRTHAFRSLGRRGRPVDLLRS